MLNVFFRVYHVKYSFHLYRMSSNHVLRDMFDSSSDDEDELLEDLRALRFLLECRKSLKKRVSCRTSILTGKMYTLEFLSSDTRCFESFRMEVHVFKNLCDKLKSMNLLVDDKKVSVEEGVGMFLLVVCHNTRHRLVTERFQHSTGTVHRWFKKVLRALCNLGNHIISPRNPRTVQPEILSNPKWYPYFKVMFLVYILYFNEFSYLYVK